MLCSLNDGAIIHGFVSAVGFFDVYESISGINAVKSYVSVEQARRITVGIEFKNRFAFGVYIHVVERNRNAVFIDVSLIIIAVIAILC